MSSLPPEPPTQPPPASSDASAGRDDAQRGIAALVVNSRARLAKSLGWRDAVKRRLARRFHLEFLFPKSADESAEVARESAEAGADVVVAAGGDGTINSVATGLAGTQVPLGIIPLGTANDLARELGLPRELDAAAQRIADGSMRRVDLVRVNDRVFCTVGGIALTAQTALMVSRLKAVSPTIRRLADVIGGGIYRVASVANLLGRRRVSERVSIEYTSPDGSEHALELDAHTVFVANHRTLGGGLVLPISSSPQDGVFELCLVPRRSRGSLLVNFGRLAAGAPLPDGVIVTLPAIRATLRTELRDEFVADGDLLATGQEFRLAAYPSALTLIV